MSSIPAFPKYSEIADRVGVSTMTVSNVLRNRPGVSEAKRREVHDALRKMGVSVKKIGNTKTSASKRRRTRSILLIEGGTPPGALASPVYSQLYRGVEQGCREHSWALQIHHATSTRELERIARDFSGAGILMFGKGVNEKPFFQADPGLAIVRMLGQGREGAGGIDIVGYDDRAVGELAARELMEMGCERLACIGGGPYIRSDSFLALCRAEGIACGKFADEHLYDFANERQFINHSVLEKLWEEAAALNPDGLFVMADQVTVALYGLLQRAGFRPEKDIRIVSCNYEEPFLGALNPRPKSVDIQIHEVGRSAVEQIFRRLEAPQAIPRRILLEPQVR